MKKFHKFYSFGMASHFRAMFFWYLVADRAGLFREITAKKGKSKENSKKLCVSSNQSCDSLQSEIEYFI